jgi:hypothetical protein
MASEFWEHCNTVEECYEFMLAYAAQGHSSEETDQRFVNFCSEPQKLSPG